MKLANYLCGEWLEGSGSGAGLSDPVTGEVLVSVDSSGIDVKAGLAYARETGQTGLQQLTYQARAELLGEIANVLAQHKDEYYRISLRNSGATTADAAFDVDGALFTLKSYARAGRSLGGNRYLVEGANAMLAKTGDFQARHFLKPMSGVAVFINAFNFPAWGLWEKAAPALLSGMPVLIKPATPTAWLTQRMVSDVVSAGILPEGAMNIVCGSARDLLDHVEAEDVVSFTGSAETAALIRSHPKVVAGNVRVNIEADSLNSAVIGPEVSPDDDEFKLAVREIVKEMTIKSGQKCTAIRRIFVPQSQVDALVQQLQDKLQSVTVGNPRDESVRMGPLVSRAQKLAAESGLDTLKQEARVVFGAGSDFQPLDGADSEAFFQPTLLLCDDPAAAEKLHDVEVFGPVATILPYRDSDQLLTMLKRGKGSLVVSLYSADQDFLAAVVPQMADWHGRIMVVDGAIGSQHSGHGNVMPNCLHGGPGRAGGGEELGGLRALAFYHRRYVVQGGPDLLQRLSQQAADYSLLNE